MKDNIIKAFETLVDHAKAVRESVFKVRMYQKAIQAFKSHNGDIRTFSDAQKVLRRVFKTPGKIEEKTKELFETGKISAVVAAEKNDVAKAIKVLTSVPQIGPSKAMFLVKNHGITSIALLKKATHLLHDKQIMGLKYYDELIDPNTLDAKRIPRSEIDAFAAALKRFVPRGMKYEILGSYRRGAPESGDIDVLFTGKGEGAEGFKTLIRDLTSAQILGDHFSAGSTKWMGMGKPPGFDTHRRIDLMRVSEDEYPFAVLYFTGSKEFNERFRGIARAKGYTLNEHRIEHIHGARRKVDHKFTSERDIFEFLGVPYVTPRNRTRGKFSLRNVSVKSL